MAEPSTITFADAIREAFRKFSDFNGRATKPEFWWFALFWTIVTTALQQLDLVTPDGSLALGTALSSVWTVLTLLPLMAVGARRLRDAGRSPKELWWLLLPIAGLIILIFRWIEPTQPPVP